MRSILFVISILFSMTLSAQTDRQLIREGNRLFRMKDYAKAEVQYRKALEANQQNPQANYNLGCALMMQQKDSAAVVQYEKAARIEPNKMRRSPGSLQETEQEPTEPEQPAEKAAEQRAGQRQERPETR